MDTARRLVEQIRILPMKADLVTNDGRGFS
jgi:hypothetical protein